MGDWYTIGLALGLGIAIGTLFAGLLSATPLGRGAAVVLAGVAGALVGTFVDDWTELVAGAVGGILGAVGAAIIVAGALRRGGTRAGLALIVAAVAAGLAGARLRSRRSATSRRSLLPFLAVRLRRTQAERYAGLRTLAKD